jgi:predicted metalloprotease
MRWRRTRSSPDVIDRRGARGRGVGLPVAGAGGLGGVGLVVFLLIQLIGGGGGATGFGVDDPFATGVNSPEYAEIPPEQDPDRDLKDFSAYVFDNAQRSWEETFERSGRSYDRAQLVLFSGGVSTGCGSASSAVGPFYCPADQRVYLDLSFYREMESELGADGDFAWAYVIAHEVGHHVQGLLGTSGEVRRLEQKEPDEANELSVRVELQADCYAGVWSHSVRAAGDLEKGDIQEALGAAEAVGDDRLQERARGSVDPDSFTHGTSEQRATWFAAGDDAGEPAACDTFSPDDV